MVDVVLTNPIARITTSPRMPSVVLGGHINNGNLTGTPRFEAYVEYQAFGRTDRTETLSGAGQILTPTQWRFVIDFGDRVQGGTFHVRLTLQGVDSNGNVHTEVLTGTSSIVGINPTKAEIKARLAAIELQLLAYKESRFRQFDTSGQPVVNPARDFGIMQLHQTATTPTARQIWDWKQNVDAGIALFHSKQATVRKHFANIRKKNPGAPPLTADQLKLADYQNYHGGYYWKWDKPHNAWLKLGPGSTRYADDVLRIEKLVRAGTPPADWD